MSTCPAPLPRWFLAFERWREHGGLPGDRPATVPKVVPGWAWSCYRERHPIAAKPVYQLPFKPPVAFYRRPSSSAIGITEALAVFPGDVAIDPLVGDDWDDFIHACRARGRKVYGWTRISYRNMAWWFGERCRALGISETFPNVEDDDLRGNTDVVDFLAYVEAMSPGRVGVLTNYNVSSLWPKGHAFEHLPVLPEWFPREIHDATATLEGSLATGRQHFAAAVPLLDGREHGLASFPYPAGAYCIWPADNVDDWRAWVR